MIKTSCCRQESVVKNTAAKLIYSYTNGSPYFAPGKKG